MSTYSCQLDKYINQWYSKGRILWHRPPEHREAKRHGSNSFDRNTVSSEIPSGHFQDLARLSDSTHPFFVTDPDVDKTPPELLLPDLTTVTRYETREWLNDHGVTHNCKGALLWSVVMTAKPVYKPKAGYVYFISNPETGKIKIGFSDDPERRLAEGKTWCPRLQLTRTIRVADMAAEEAYYHKRFGKSHFDGEWFLPDKDILEFLSNEESTTYGLMSGLGE